VKKILIIEDDDNISSLEKDYLETHEFEVEVVNNGKEGVERFYAKDYNLVIVDWMLPIMNGMDVLKKIREKSDVPVLFVSAKKEDIDKIKALGLGADDYMTKPFSPSELVARVKAHIVKYERIVHRFSSKEDSLMVGTIEIQRKSGRVFVSGYEVFFTQKEYELLLFLMENPNVLFKREQLFEKIWGLDVLGETATVTVHINRIREKLEKHSSGTQYIETVWGGGYRFKSNISQDLY
jgi:two-component system OmpR family response regulator